MFKKILLAPNQTLANGPCDIGAVAESLLFYEETILTLHYGGFKSLIETFGADNFLTLLKETDLKFKFIIDQPGVSNRDERYGTSLFKLAKMTNEDMVIDALKSITNRQGYSRDIGKDICNHLEFITSSQGFPDRHLSHLTYDEIQNNKLNAKVIPKIIQIIAPDYNLPEGCAFYVYRGANGLIISTDINFGILNYFHKRTFPNSDFTVDKAYFLALIQDSFLDMSLSSLYEADLYTNPTKGLVIEEKLQSIAQFETLEEVKNFQEIILPHGRTLRQVMNAGERTLAEFLQLLDEAQKFKKWVSQIGNDKKLIAEYCQAINSLDLINRLPSKILRFILPFAANTFNPPLGLALSGFDSFFADKLLSGWKPSMFIDNLDCFTNPVETF